VLVIIIDTYVNGAGETVIVSFLYSSVTSYCRYYLVYMDCNQDQQRCARPLTADTHRVRAERFDTARFGIHDVTTDYCRYAIAIKYKLIVTLLRSIAFLRTHLFVIYFFETHAAFYLDISTVLFSIPMHVGKNSPFRCDYVALSYVLNMPCYS